MTSSPRTVMPSIRTQRPTVDRQPTIQLSSHAWLLIIAPSKIVERLIQAPVDKSIDFQFYSLIEFFLLWSCKVTQKHTKTHKNQKIWNIPSSTTQFGPIVTFGPIRHPLPSIAVGCTNTFPTIVRFSAEHWYNFDASFWRNEFKYKHIPEIKM